MLTHAVVQLGYCVFGVGESEDEAYEDAAPWMVDDEGDSMTAETVEAMCDDGRRNRVHGAIVLMTSDHPEFDSYMENQGGFVKTEEGWTHAKVEGKEVKL